MIATTTRILSFVLAASLLATPRVLAADSGDAAYATLAQAYYTGVFKLNPTYATNVGVHDYDDQLGDYSAAGVDKQIAYDRDYLAKVTAIDPASLSPSVALDRTLLENRLHDRILLADTLGVWKHSPDYYTRAASGAVFSIMSKDYAPLTTRIVYAAAREEQIPAMLQDAEHNITSVDAVTQRIAAADAAGSVSFFKNSVPLAFTDVHDAALQSRLQSANAGAMSAMSAYAAWIKALKPSGTYAIGADAYKARLLYEDALDIPLDQYLAVGERALAQTRAEFIEAARKIDPNATPQQVYLTITKAQPPPDSLLATAERDLARLRAFVEAKHIVSLPREREHQGDRHAAVRAAHDHRRRRLARSTGNRRDAGVLLRHAGRPGVAAAPERRLPRAVQRLRVSDHFGARSLSRAISPTSRSNAAST